MKKENGNTFNSQFINKYSDCTVEYLPVYLSAEDIKNLNYPEVLEEILTKANHLTLNYPEVLDEILRKVDASVFSSRSGSALSVLKSYSRLLLDNKSIKLKTVAAGSAVALILIYASNGLYNRVEFNKNNNSNNPMEYAQLTSNSLNCPKNNETMYETIKSASLPDNLISSVNISCDVNIKKSASKRTSLASRSNSLPEAKSSTPFTELKKMDASELIKLSKRKYHMTATAYDLSYRSCSKTREHPAYGITASGTRATIGRTIAVDPTIIPLGSKVYITFPEKYSYMNGVYIAEDTGSLIKGNKVDIFFGEDNPGETVINNKAFEFGLQLVEIYLLG